MNKLINNNYLFIILSLIIFSILSILLFKDISSREIELWDERTNIEVIRESIDKPYLYYNNEVFLEKPPLWYYMGILGNRLIKDDISVYRSISCLSSLLSTLLLFIIVLKRAGRIRSILFLILIMSISHLYTIDPSGYFSTHILSSADLDPLQILFIVLSFFIIVFKKDIKYISLSYLSLSLGFLTKGPFVLLPLLLNTWYLVKKGIKISKLIIPFIVFLTPVLLWIMLMYTNYGNYFIKEFIDYHILNRSINAIEGHNEPIWFYIQLFLDPRINILGIPFIFLIRSRLKGKNLDIKLYSFLFIIFTLLMFSLVSTKLAWYILPQYFFLALFLSL